MQDIVLFLQTHWTLSLPLISILLVLTLLEWVRHKQGASQISPARLTQLINHDNAVIVDLRSSDLYKDGHIIGAILLPASELNQNPKKLDAYKTKPIVLVCATGLESPKIAPTLLKEGLNIHVLNGGIRAWREANMPLIKG